MNFTINRYADTRDKIQSGDLLVWSATKLRSFRDLQLHIIQLATRSSFDHVALAWKIGGRNLVVEATPPETRIYPLYKLTPFYWVPMNVDWKEEYNELLLDTVGDKYSIWQAIQSYFTVPKDDREWQCAELVTSFYEYVGLPHGFGYTPKSVVEHAVKVSGNGLFYVGN